MQKRFKMQRLRFALAVVLGAICIAPPVQKLAEYPSDISVPLGERAFVPIGLPGYTDVHTSNNRVVQLESFQTNHSGQAVAVVSRYVGDATVSTRLFGIVPWNTVHVHVVPEEKVYVGGQSVGIRLHSRGVMIVGFQRVGEKRQSPASDADLRIGDVIESIDNHLIRSAADIRQRVSAGRPVTITVRRGSDRKTIQVTPVVDEDGNGHLGIFARDKTAGVGTLTFYDPQHHHFGALGHVITDVDTGQPILGYGSLHESEVTGVVKGTAGQPGEKKGRFVHQNMQIGHINENTQYGVYGSMRKIPTHGLFTKEFPVALPSQVHEGPAKMLTVVHGEKVEEFNVTIENLVKQERPDTKSMVIHVTDDRLLHLAGGIVQGMSGSPLIQDGRLVGAVTHVFVSDPTRGYGVYAAWMMKESEDLDREASSSDQSQKHVV